LKLPLPIDEAESKKMLDFLVNCGLCTRDGNFVKIGRRRTHLQDQSTLRVRHHTNWHLKAIDQMSKRSDDDLFFTAPMRIDEHTFLKIKAELKELIVTINKEVDRAGDTTLVCFNIDWFKF
jgi:hypothetical protein